MIRIKGARENNLKNIDLEVPRNQFVVFTGLSGSGKSSLAFDTIYAEGQRRYMESLSSYARQFLGQMEKPDVDSIEGLSPAISIDQKSTNRNPRSTVGTVTEIYDYFRLLYARVGIPHCPKCGKPISKQTVDQMVDRLMQLEERTRIQLLAPIVRGRKGEHAKVFQNAKKSGYVRVRVDGNVYDLSEDIPMEKNKKHNIEIVVDRLVVKPGIEKRLTDSIETTLNLADGLMMVDVIGGETLNFSQSFSCPDCDISIDEVEPRSFSFNNPFGACPVCHGLGYKMEFDVDLMIPDQKLSIAEGAIQVFGWQSSTDKKSYTRAILDALAREYHFDLETPFKDYPQEVKDVLLYGTGGREVKVYYKGQRGEGVYDVAFEGIIKNVGRRYREASQNMKAEYETFMTITPCDECHGQRLKQESLAVTVADKNIAEMCNMSVGEMVSFLETMELSERQKLIGEQVLKEIKARIGFLNDVGLDYLTLSRATGTLSGGEAQRIRLATQIGSGLVGVAYILDEPSIGLHQRDNDKLIRTLKNLRDLGNTLIVVEHDEDTMLAADYIVDIGPKAGEYGGEVVGAGKGKFAGGTEIPKGTRIDIISGSSQFSPEWQTYLSEFPKADLSSAQIKSITAIKPDPENGVLRPNPEVYLSKEYLEQHKRLFDGGVAAFVKDNENIIRYNQFGRDDGAFVFPRHVADAMIKEANGDARKLEALLGLDPGSLGDSPKMVVPQEVHNYRIPDGNEEGSRVNPQWRPGGKTYLGGVPEAVIDKVPIDKLDLIEIWENDKGDKNGNNSRK